MQALPRRNMLAFIITALIAFADQVTKQLIMNSGIALGENVDFIPWFVNITYVKNDGAAWGILDDARWVFMSLSTVAMIAIVYILIKYRRRHVVLEIGLAFVLGGGIGNMIDRVIYGSVTDFLHFTSENFPILNRSFPVFNVADIFVTVGAFVLIFYLVFLEPKVESRINAAAKPTDDTESHDS